MLACYSLDILFRVLYLLTFSTSFNRAETETKRIPKIICQVFRFKSRAIMGLLYWRTEEIAAVIT